MLQYYVHWELDTMGSSKFYSKILLSKLNMFIPLTSAQLPEK